MVLMPFWLWKRLPWWVLRLRLFSEIVWREWEGRLSVSLAWEIASIIHPRPERP